MQLFKMFRGREPGIEPLLRHMGIAQTCSFYTLVTGCTRVSLFYVFQTKRIFMPHCTIEYSGALDTKHARMNLQVVFNTACAAELSSKGY